MRDVIINIRDLKEFKKLFSVATKGSMAVEFKGFYNSAEMATGTQLMRLSLNGWGNGDNKITIKVDTFKRYLKAMKGDHLRIMNEKGMVTLFDGEEEYELKDGFVLKEDEEERVTYQKLGDAKMTAGEWLEAIKKVEKVVSTDKIRHNLRTIKVEADAKNNMLAFVATNGRAIIKYSVFATVYEDFELLIPREHIATIKATLEKLPNMRGVTLIKYKDSKEQFRYVFGGEERYYFGGETFDDVYPHYQALFNQEASPIKLSLILKRDTVLSALKSFQKLNVLEVTDSYSVKISLKRGVLSIQRTDNNGKIFGNPTAIWPVEKYRGTLEAEWNFDAGYLIDLLESLDSKTVTFSFRANKRDFAGIPLVITCEIAWKALLMPLRVR